MVRKESLRSLHRKGMTGLSIEQRKSVSKTQPLRVFNTTMPIMHAQWIMLVDGVAILTVVTKQTIHRIAHPIRATRVSKWQLDVGTRIPPMLVTIDALELAIPAILNAALALRAPMDFASRIRSVSRIRATRVSKWRLDVGTRSPRCWL